MGSFADLYFSDYPVNTTKNYLDHWIFKESDKVVSQRKNSERNDYVKGDFDDDEIETAYTFVTSRETMINRLEILGYTLETCRNDFDLRVKEELYKLKDIEEYDLSYVRKRQEIHSKYPNYDNWLEAFRIIIEEKLKSDIFTDEPNEYHHNPLVNFMLNSRSIWIEESHPFGFEYPCQDFNFFARTFLEACKPDSEVLLDATDLVYGGWYDGFEHLEDSIKKNTRFYDIFMESLNEIETVMKVNQSNEKTKSLLAKLLYANIITALECYLSDTFIYTVVSFPPLVRRIVETDPEFSKRKLELTNIFRRYDGIRDEVSEYLESLIYHNLSKVNQLYKAVLCVNFPKNLAPIYTAIKIRHDIVHRYGKNKVGEEHTLTDEKVFSLINEMKIFIRNIDKQVMNIYPQMRGLEI